jgi:hypothetical protein
MLGASVGAENRRWGDGDEVLFERGRDHVSLKVNTAVVGGERLLYILTLVTRWWLLWETAFPKV